MTYGVEINATSILNLLHGHFMTRSPAWLEMTMTGAYAIILLLVFRMSGHWKRVGFVLLALLIPAVVSLWINRMTGFWFPWLTLACISLPIAFVLSWVPGVKPPHEDLKDLTSTGKLTPLVCASRGSLSSVWLVEREGDFEAAKWVRETRGHRDFYDAERAANDLFHERRVGHPNILKVSRLIRPPGASFQIYTMQAADDATTGGRPEVPYRYKPRTLTSLLQHDASLLTFETWRQHAVGIASAVAYLHENGLVHCDIKPSNILIIHGEPVLADIGLLRERGIHPVPLPRNLVHDDYTPPEDRGTPVADVYSTGRTLGRLLSRVKDGSEPQKKTEAVTILERATAGDPTDRFPDAVALLAALHSIGQ